MSNEESLVVRKVTKKMAKEIASIWAANMLLESEFSLAATDCNITVDSEQNIAEAIFSLAEKMLKGRPAYLGETRKIVDYVINQSDRLKIS